MGGRMGMGDETGVVGGEGIDGGGDGVAAGGASLRSEILEGGRSIG